MADQSPDLRLSLHQRKFLQRHVGGLGMAFFLHDGFVCTSVISENVVEIDFQDSHLEGRDRLHLEQVTRNDVATSGDDVSSYVVVLALRPRLPLLHPRLNNQRLQNIFAPTYESLSDLGVSTCIEITFIPFLLLLHCRRLLLRSSPLRRHPPRLHSHPRRCRGHRPGHAVASCSVMKAVPRQRYSLRPPPPLHRRRE